jgi:hypothetical protein
MELERLFSNDPTGLENFPAKALGYTCVWGEAFRHFLSKKIYFRTYTASCGFIFALSGSRSLLSLKRASEDEFKIIDNFLSKAEQKAVIISIDAIISHSFSIIFLPSIITRMIRISTEKIMDARALRSSIGGSNLLPVGIKSRIKYLPGVVGVASFPFIFSYIDQIVNIGMDNSFRKLW